MIDLICNFFVVSSGNPGPCARKSNRVCAPNTDNVPVPVRSVRSRPFSSTSRRRSWYCRTPKFYRGASHSGIRISCCYELFSNSCVRTQFAKCDFNFGVQRCSEQCRVDAIADLAKLENEPNCLNSRFPVRSHISVIPWLASVYAGCSGLVQPLLRYHLG